jgi:two-component system KDP operon response regulator KdpE
MAIKPLVLAVDDEPSMLRLISMTLTEDGFRVLSADDGAEALRIAERHRPDLIVLDVLMPRMNGLEVMERLRDRIRTPVILVTARNANSERVTGLDAGADDYLTKPFNPAELTARARAVLRRANRLPGDGTRLRADGIEIDLSRRLVKKGGEVVPLTRTEWRLLQYLATNAGRVVLNSELLARVWGSEYRHEIPYLRVWISRLRAKLEQVPSEPKILQTIPGIGYMFTAGERINGNGNGGGDGHEARPDHEEPVDAEEEIEAEPRAS